MNLLQAKCQCELCTKSRYPRFLQTPTVWGDVLIRLAAVSVALVIIWTLLWLAWTVPLFGIAAGTIIATAIVIEVLR